MVERIFLEINDDSRHLNMVSSPMNFQFTPFHAEYGLIPIALNIV